eukprot:scpid58499/ scgid0350/ Putative glycerol-3-phosphate transporter 1; Glycerol-3-phosphate permease 1; Protein PHOSPHATE STARVATION-INDUCED GENE 3
MASANPSETNLHASPSHAGSANAEQSRSKWVCLALAWLSYAGITALRKPLGVGKKPLSKDLHLGRTELGFLDMAFLMPYAIVQVTVGSQADKVAAHVVLFFVLFTSSTSMLSFGMWNSLLPLVVLLFIAGSAQAFGWPACVKLVSGWFPSRSSSNVFGVFGTCMSVGGIGGTMLAVWLLAHWSWRYSFLPQSIFVLVLSFVVLLFLPVAPSNLDPLSQTAPLSPSASTPKSVNTLQLLSIECVKELCLANFLIKLVRYAFFMWLPLYLSEQLHFTDSHAGLMSTTFEIGGFVGTLFSGTIIEKLYGGRQLSTMTGLLLVGCVSIGAFIATAKQGMVMNCAMLSLAGAANVATDPIISAMVPMSIAELEGTNIKAGLASVINGMGSVGVILEGPLIGKIADLYGWSVCLYVLVSLQILSLVLVRLAASHQRNKPLS